MKAILSHLSITKALLALFFPLFILASCRTYSDDDLHSFDKQISAYILKKNWKMERSESGLYTQVVDKGDSLSRAISFTSEITITYKGKLLNGKTVDQSLPGKPLVSKLSGLIGGFQEGLFDQHEGAKIRLIIPPNLGYGDKQEGIIPANSVLVFEVEIVGVH